MKEVKILTVYTLTIPVMDIIYSNVIIVGSWGYLTIETNLQVKEWDGNTKDL